MRFERKLVHEPNPDESEEPIRTMQTRVWLSRRNLEALLVKLDDPTSKRTIFCFDDHGNPLWVTSEENEEHYKGRTPGEMHPRTEQMMEEL